MAKQARNSNARHAKHAMPARAAPARPDKKANGFLFWIPRILSILLIIFLALMSLDVITPGLSLWQIIVGLFMHNIPVFILLAVLLISWKYEIVGGIVFILAGLLYIFMLMGGQFGWYKVVWAIQISGVSFLIGALFLIGWFRKKKRK
jgi:hypothetical protein